MGKKIQAEIDSLPLFGAAKKTVPPAQKPEELATAAPLVPLEPTPEKVTTPASQSSSEGRKESLRYYEKKRIVLQREKKNQTEMIFIKSPSKNSWYKAFGRSAVYFDALYKNKIGSKAKLQADKDYQFQSREGFVSVPNIKTLAEKLERVGVELVDAKDEIYTFSLGKRIKTDEYNLLRKQTQALVERANEMIKPKEMMPNLFEDIKETFRTIFWAFKDMSDLPKLMIGRELAGLIRDIGVEYTVIAKSDGDAEAFLDFAMENVDRADGYFLMLSPLRIMNDDKQLEIAGLLSKLRNQIIFEKKKLAVQKIENEHKGKNKK